MSIKSPHGPVLVICADEGVATDILIRLYDLGVSVVGPASTARLALALAGQTLARSAILVGETTGQRTAAELAEELQKTWGIDCVGLSSRGVAACAALEAADAHEPRRVH